MAFAGPQAGRCRAKRRLAGNMGPGSIGSAGNGQNQRAMVYLATKAMSGPPGHRRPTRSVGLVALWRCRGCQLIGCLFGVELANLVAEFGPFVVIECANCGGAQMFGVI